MRWSEKVQSREKWVRRKASELGLIVRKSRSDGSWIVIDPHARPMATLVAGYQEATGKTGWPLDWVEGYLSDAVRGERQQLTA